MSQHYQTYQQIPNPQQRLTPQPQNTHKMQEPDDAQQFKIQRPPSNNQMYATAPAQSIGNNLDALLKGSQKRPVNGGQQPQDQLQRLLSEDRDSSNNNGGGATSSRIKLGFQENLNRRGSSNGNTNGVNTLGASGPSGPHPKQNGQNSQLNKAAIVTMITSHQQTTTSDSSKMNSQLVVKSSLWLLTSPAAIKNKKVQELVQNRQKTCNFCQTNKLNQLPSLKSPQNTFFPSQHSHQHFPYHENLKSLVRESLDKKYLTSQDYYNSKIVSDIMYNENRHIVSVFKDYLIFDDFSEYLKRYYRDHEAFDRLPKVLEFYEKYSKVFPNYVALPGESKYMFKNIERKQKLIDEKHQQIIERQEKLRQEQEEARALGLALDSSVVQRMRHSKNVIFGSQFMNDLTEIINHPSGSDLGEQDNSLMRQQSSKKILDMLTTIQNQAPPYQTTSVMNQFMKQHQKNAQASARNQPVLTQQSTITKQGDLEYLINQLTQYDNRNDSAFFNQAHGQHLQNKDDLLFLAQAAADLSMTSSHGMSSFLQDFDLREGGGMGGHDHHFNRLDVNYRTQQPLIDKATIGRGLEDFDEDDYIEDNNNIDEPQMAETPVKLQQQTHTSGSRASMQDSKRASTKNLNGTGSRQSLNNQAQRQERITPPTTMIVANGKNLVSSYGGGGGSGTGKMSHSKKNSIKTTTGQQPMQMVSNGVPMGTAISSQQQSNSKSQWGNMLLSSNNKKPDSVRKVNGNKNVNAAGYATQPAPGQSNQQSQKITKQPTPKGARVTKNNNLMISNPNPVMGGGTLTGSTSPQTLMVLSRGGVRSSMNSAEQHLQNQYQTNQPSSITLNQNQQQVIQQQLSQSSFKSGQSQGLNVGGGQQMIQMTIIPPNGGRTSQVSLGSPLSQHSTSTLQPHNNPKLTVPNKQTFITKEMLQSMPAGSSLKQIATAVAKANMGQPRTSISGANGDTQQSAKKSSTIASSRASNTGNQAVNHNAKPNLQIPLQTHNHQQLLPRSGPNAVAKSTESFNTIGQSTPQSNGGLNIPSHGQLGSAGNSQSSMRVSPDFSLVPNHVLMLSGSTPGSGSSLKKISEVSKSFKAQPQGSLANISAQQQKLNPNAISQSIREAVSKLLPPQPKVQQHNIVSSSLQFTSSQNQNPLKSSVKHESNNTPSPASATAPPQSFMSNTAALFNKLFTGNQSQQSSQKSNNPLRSSQQNPLQDQAAHQIFKGGHPHGQQILEEDNNAQQLSAVYSTRVPQKKNFSSPDDLQLRIAARKNQHQQLAIATAQNTLQPIRKSQNDFNECHSISPQHQHHQGIVGSRQKKLVVVKPRNGGSPQSAQNAASGGQPRYRKIKLGSDGGGRMGSAEKEDYSAQAYQHHLALYGGGSLGGDDLEEALEEEQEYLDDEHQEELDERNDVYTAKGHANQQITQSLKQEHHGQLRQMASSATATTSTNAYNFKMTGNQQASTNKDGTKRHPSMNSDKSHTSSVKSTYTTNQHPYARVLTGFSSGTKKKVKVGGQGAPTLDHQQTVQGGSLGSKLYEKIRSGMQGNQNAPSTFKTHNANYNTNPSPGTITTTNASAAGKKKPSTIFTFNK